MTVRDKILAIEQEMKEEIIGRPEIIRSIIRATISNQHVMVIGPPGNAKTMCFERFFGRITGASVFNTLITPYTSADEVMGPASIRILKDEDRIQRNTEGMFPQADYAVMDEFWNQPETLSASLLRALNERQVFDGSKFVDIPLKMMVAASNKLPYGEGFLAVLDRIVIRHYLPAPGATEVDLFEKILTSGLNDKPTTISKKEIEEATKEAMELPVSGRFYDFISKDLRPALIKTEQGLSEASVSARRWKAGINVAKAEAWLRGDDEVTAEHAIVYKDIVWNKEPQIKKVQSLIERMCGNPQAMLDGNSLRDELKAIVEGHDADMTRAETLGDPQSGAASVTNKTKLWNDKLKEVKEDWFERFRKDDDYKERTQDVDLASQMMASRAKRAYENVMGS